MPSLSSRLFTVTCLATFTLTLTAQEGEKTSAVSVAAPPKAQVFWGRQSFTPQDPPAELPEAALRTLGEWWPWALEHDYRIDLDTNARAMILSDYRERRITRVLERVEATLDLFDEHLPLPQTELASVLPLITPEPVEEPVVLLRVRDREDHYSALDHVVLLNERLAPWAYRARAGVGFSLTEPLVGSWIVNEPGIDEWREENELVNRMASALLAARFGQQPHWLAQGVAWFAELEITSGIYCFPGRDGFVGISEHGGWESELRRTFRKRKDALLDVHELTDWRRGTFDEEAGALAWGVVGFLVQHRSGALPAIAREMGAQRQTFGVLTHTDGSWEVLTDYEIPADVQRQILEHHAGADLWQETSRAFSMGSRYKPAGAR